MEQDFESDVNIIFLACGDEVIHHKIRGAAALLLLAGYAFIALQGTAGYSRTHGETPPDSRIREEERG
jgi:hypothetical protein